MALTQNELDDLISQVKVYRQYLYSIYMQTERAQLELARALKVLDENGIDVPN